MTESAMSKAINMKSLLSIVAVLAAIGGALTYQRHESAKAAAILHEQRKETDERKAEDVAFRKRVEADKKKHDSAAAHEGKTWQTYIP
jgi:HD superfamily phosphohydrolase YqeK